MTQADKELLLKDLCARLPYSIKFPITVKNPITSEPIEITGTISTINRHGIVSFVWDYEGQEILVKDSLHIKDVKPYLFPLSSMTEEQKQEYTYIVNYISSDDTENWKEGEFIYVEQFTQLMHFYHANHLDYMGLIPMGLVNDATGKNIY